MTEYNGSVIANGGAIGPSEHTEWPILAPKALYSLAGDIVNAATEESEADPAAVLATLLPLIGIAVGRGPYVKISDDIHHARLFTVIVGKSARGRKGTSEGPVRRIWDVAARTLGPLNWKPGPMSSGEGLINAIRDGDGKEDGGVPDKRLFIVESEFAAPLRAMRREGNTLSAILRTAWDGKTLEPLTKTSPIKASEPHVGIVAHITQAELRTLLGNIEIFNGFANRFVWFGARRNRFVPLARGMRDEDVERLGRELAKRIRIARNLKCIKFSSEARDLYIQRYPQLTADHDGLFGVVISRAEVQVIRLALVYALLDASHEIVVNHLKAAFAVWDYCSASAARLFGSIASNPLEARILSPLRNPSMGPFPLHFLERQ